MAKQAYVSITDLAWESMGHPAFETLKTGYVGPVHGRPTEEYEVVDGVPPDAKLAMVIYVFESQTLPFQPNPIPVLNNALAGPSVTISVKRREFAQR